MAQALDLKRSEAEYQVHIDTGCDRDTIASEKLVRLQENPPHSHHIARDPSSASAQAVNSQEAAEKEVAENGRATGVLYR